MKNTRPLISSELLDKLLNYLIDNNTIESYQRVDRNKVREHMGGIDLDIIDGMFSILTEEGFISDYVLGNSTVTFVIKGKASRLKTRGGFRAQDELVNKQMKLLEKQIEDLQKSNVLSKSSTIVATVANLSKLVSQAFNQFD